MTGPAHLRSAAMRFLEAAVGAGATRATWASAAMMLRFDAGSASTMRLAAGDEGGQGDECDAHLGRDAVPDRRRQRFHDAAKAAGTVKTTRAAGGEAGDDAHAWGSDDTDGADRKAADRMRRL